MYVAYLLASIFYLVIRPYKQFTDYEIFERFSTKIERAIETNKIMTTWNLEAMSQTFKNIILNAAQEKYQE